MKYEKPEVTVIRFDAGSAFMTGSTGFTSVDEALEQFCGGYAGAPNNFTCRSFGGYGSGGAEPSQNDTVVLTSGNYTFVFDFVGNHWKLSK